MGAAVGCDFGSASDAQVGAELAAGPWLWNPTLMPPTMHGLAETQFVPGVALSGVVCGSVHAQMKCSPLPMIASECCWT